MPSAVTRDSWACDYCGTEGFRSFDEVKAHERNCQQGAARKRQRPGSPGQPPPGMAPLSTTIPSEVGGDYEQSAHPKMRHFAILTSDEVPQHDLDEGDALACQNLEVFEAGPDVVGDPRFGPAGPGQVGIRCIHCAQRPTNEYSIYFPDGTQTMGTGIHMLAERHLVQCPAVPGGVREALQRSFDMRRQNQEDSRSAAEEERSRMALAAYCSMFCRNCTIVDRYPGLSFDVGDSRSHPGQPYQQGNPTPPGRPGEMPYPTSAGPRGPYPPMMTHMSGDTTIAATPLARTSKDHERQGPPAGFGEFEGGYSGYPTPYASGPRGVYPEGMGAHTPHTRPDAEAESQPPPPQGPLPHESPAPGYLPYGMGPYGMSPQGDFPYYQESNGSWVCRHCSSLPPQYRDQGAAWNGPEPPPAQFASQHLQVCRAYNQFMSSQGMYPGQAPPFSAYSPFPPYGGPSFPPGPSGMGTPGAPPMSTPMHPPHYSTPHSGGETPYHYPPPPHEHPPSMPPRPEGPREDPTVGLSRASRGPPQVPVSVPRRQVGGGDLQLQAIRYLAEADRDKMYQGEFGDTETDQLVLDEDKMLLTDYFFYLMKQLRICRFTEADRKTRGGKRENIAVGYGGLQCIHCQEAPNARKFFWSNVDRLANSFAEIPAHVLKCRRCPVQTKDAITELKTRHSEQMSKLPRGSQKVFFRRMWRRLHDKDPKPEGVPFEEEESEHKEPEVVPPPVGQKIESASPSNQHLERTASSPGTSTDESAVLVERPTDEAAKALAASATGHSDPPSPSSRVLLAIPEDKEWLSDMDCFVRRNLEVFCATQEDVDTAQDDRKYPVNVGQVGIRCIHCALSKGGKGARGSAVAYPYSISGIYESVREFQRLHLDMCTNVPPATKQKLSDSKGASSLSSVLRKYYVLAAKALGMYDTPDGIRSGAEAVPLGSSAAFAFAEGTSKVSEEMRKESGPPAAFVETGPAITPLERRKRKQPEETEGKPSEDEPAAKREVPKEK